MHACVCVCEGWRDYYITSIRRSLLQQEEVGNAEQGNGGDVVPRELSSHSMMDRIAEEGTERSVSESFAFFLLRFFLRECIIYFFPSHAGQETIPRGGGLS